VLSPPSLPLPSANITASVLALANIQQDLASCSLKMVDCRTFLGSASNPQ
jgi:hypothetical protein